MAIERIQSGPRMSQAVIHNKTVYLSGQVAESARGKNVTVQTTEILASIDRLLAAAKTDKSRLLSAMIWLTDMSTFQEMNKVWEAWVVPGPTLDHRASESRAGRFVRGSHRIFRQTEELRWL